ncbi:DUF4328 domain-containing protein [Streptomyces sp. ISL-98]|uniref:protein kinase domain-containing protein n=1 Tax=Streptomyces sp. ISL-98 TaxID=2819192 RepID=UPI001BE715E3|nr:DUF4328 domain-containing protein [Streptomyces sp. ISL-98]MBT2508646.1 DUF4328 domain-containing protein [Streptomyces sp. ISL-98]
MEYLNPGDPRAIGAYRLLRRLGAGGMGQVYLARSAGGRTVAVKLVHRELAGQAEFRRRFQQEVEAARCVGGQWTAPVLDADTNAATPWVATGYIAGPSLQDVVSDDTFGPLSERSALVLANGLLGALADIHRAGLVHRDLKPSNVLITLDGPRVIDFGIARALEPVAEAPATRTGAVIGSPGFMSPEQVRGERVGTASDVFCLGSVLAYAMTGRVPFGGVESGIHALLFRIAHEDPDLSAIPEGPILRLITACLAKNAEDRPTVAQLRELTEPYVQEQDAGAWLPAGLTAHLGRDAARLLDADMTEQPPTVVPGGHVPAAPTGQFGPAFPFQPHRAPGMHGPVPTPGFGPATPLPRPAAGGPVLKTPKGLSNALVILLGAGMLVSVIDLNYEAKLVGELNDVQSSADLTGSNPSDLLHALQLTWKGTPEAILGIWSVIMLATVVLWLIWFRRVRINAELFDAQAHRLGRGWALAAWFVPVAHLWVPKQVINDVWTASASPPAPAPYATRPERPTPSRAALHAWWLSFAGSIGLLYVSKAWQTWDEAKDLDEARLLALLSFFEGALTLASAVLAVVVVQQVTSMQQRRVTATQQRSAGGLMGSAGGHATHR